MLYTDHADRNNDSSLSEYHGVLQNTPPENLDPSPSRNLRRAARAGVHRCTFKSYKTNTLIWCESTLEKRFGLMLEYWRHVEWYEPQGITYPMIVNDRKTCFTPDYVTISKGQRPCMWEVKPSGWDQDSKMRDRIAAARKEANRNGFNFEVVTSEYIDQDPLSHNLQLIYPQIRHVSAQQNNYLLSCLTSHGGACSIEELLQMSPAPSSSAIAHHLFYRSTELELAPYSSKKILEVA